MAKREQPDTSFRPIIGRTGSPKVETKSDPNILRGEDLTKFLNVQETARVERIKGYNLTRPVPQLVAEGGTYPKIVTFRTHMALVAGNRVLIGRFDSTPQVGDLTGANGIMLTCDYADEITFVLAPGEKWYAQIPQGLAAANITVIIKSIFLLK